MQAPITKQVPQGTRPTRQPRPHHTTIDPGYAIKHTVPAVSLSILFRAAHLHEHVHVQMHAAHCRGVKQCWGERCIAPPPLWTLAAVYVSGPPPLSAIIYVHQACSDIRPWPGPLHAGRPAGALTPCEPCKRHIPGLTRMGWACAVPRGRWWGRTCISSDLAAGGRARRSEWFHSRTIQPGGSST